MKKIYESPQIIFEDMNLNSVVAACNYMAGSNDTLIPPGLTEEDGWLFLSNEFCTAGDPNGEGSDDPFCYHSPNNEDYWQVINFS